MSAATIAIVEETSGSVRYDGETFLLPAGSGGALLILDEVLAMNAVRPLPEGLALDDLVDVDPDRFCGLVRGDGNLAGLEEPITLESFAAGTTGTHLVCFNSAGLAIGVARIVQGEVIGQDPASTLDRLSGGVGWSGGFRGAAILDDLRGGVTSAVASSATDLDGIVARFNRDARLIEARHLGTPNDSEFLGVIDVGDGIIATGRYRGCISFAGRQSSRNKPQPCSAAMGSWFASPTCCWSSAERRAYGCRTTVCDQLKRCVRAEDEIRDCAPSCQERGQRW
jgi:hypothetical protein